MQQVGCLAGGGAIRQQAASAAVCTSPVAGHQSAVAYSDINQKYTRDPGTTDIQHDQPWQQDSAGCQEAARGEGRKEQ